MATLRRHHVPMPWGAKVDMSVWPRSQSGKPRRRRLDRPSLTQDSGWYWDGRQLSFNDESVVADEEECVGEFHVPLREDAGSPILLGGTPVALSILDIARYQVTESRRKARPGLGDFEIIRVPNVVPLSEDGPDLGDSWELREWEKLDTLESKRTYSEVARTFVDQR